MKYLSKFNESSNEYYKSVDYNEWIDVIFSKSIHFEERYINNIENRLKTEFKIIQPDGNYYIEIKHYKCDYEIGQCQDEWFYVRKEVRDIMSGPYNESYDYYKCDQFDGLLKFLKDYNVIN